MKEIKIQTLEEMSDQLLQIIKEHGALKIGCQRALALLEDPNGNDFEADKVIIYLNKILKGVGHD